MTPMIWTLALGTSMALAHLGSPALAALPAPWPAPVAGLAIGLFVLAFARFDGHRLGVSSGYYDACLAVTEPAKRGSWRIVFLLGLVAGGWLAARVAGGPTPGFAVPFLDEATGWSLTLKAVLFTAGGFCLGYGARLAGGCTSGHAIVGCAQLRPHSAKVAALFMIAATITTRLVLQGLGSYGSHP